LKASLQREQEQAERLRELVKSLWKQNEEMRRSIKCGK
jgi:hypothetical protein